MIWYHLPIFYYRLLRFHLLPFITLPFITIFMNHLNGNKWIFTIYYLGQLEDEVAAF